MLEPKNISAAGTALFDGYSEDEVSSFLANDKKLDPDSVTKTLEQARRVRAALSDGYSIDEVEAELNTRFSAPVTQQAAPSISTPAEAAPAVSTPAQETVQPTQLTEEQLLDQQFESFG